jgi:HEAT repeat protein
MSDEKLPQPKTYDALNSRSLAAKREYVRGLEQRRDAEAISLLVECLCDESWYLRQLAEQAFLHLGVEEAAVLLPLLEQGLWFTRSSAAGILGQLAYSPAVPSLLRLSEDANSTVAESARAALLAIGRSSGAVRIAHVLYRLAPDVRKRRLEEIAVRDAVLAERIERLMRNDEIMAVEDAETLTDDHPVVRASEDGFEWEVLTSPLPPKEAGQAAPPATTEGPAARDRSSGTEAKPPGPKEDEGSPIA